MQLAAAGHQLVRSTADTRGSLLLDLGAASPICAMMQKQQAATSGGSGPSLAARRERRSRRLFSGWNPEDGKRHSSTIAGSSGRKDACGRRSRWRCNEEIHLASWWLQWLSSAFSNELDVLDKAIVATVFFFNKIRTRLLREKMVGIAALVEEPAGSGWLRVLDTSTVNI
ncbi:hypothetical protein ACP70R_047731 [Stipagrostis hirtigluma subsp. patula]